MCVCEMIFNQEHCTLVLFDTRTSNHICQKLINQEHWNWHIFCDPNLQWIGGVARLCTNHSCFLRCSYRHKQVFAPFLEFWRSKALMPVLMSWMLWPMTARIYILDSLNQSPVIIILYRKGSNTCQIGDLPRSGTLMSYCARRAAFNRVIAQLEEYLIL